jgi:putative sterol carrier protein
MPDAPTSCKQVFDQMPSRFNKDAAKGLDAVYQFDLTGDGGGKWYAVIKDQTCEVKEGLNPSPNITITMTAQDYLDMIAGKLNGQMAFMTGKLRIAGDMGLALRLQSLFQ